MNSASTGVYRAQGFERAPSPDTIVSRNEITIERKKFVFERRQNPRGAFISIMEVAAGRRDRIAVPSSGLEAFRKALDEIIAAEGAE